MSAVERSSLPPQVHVDEDVAQALFNTDITMNGRLAGFGIDPAFEAVETTLV